MQLAHWGWYWKIKKNHTSKPLCSNFISIDSFSMFSNKQAFDWCLNQIVLEIPSFELTAVLLFDKYHVVCNAGSYDILIEQQPCNYGGVRYFFHCPKCSSRIRILYCAKGLFLCRKCINAGYASQRHLASRRNLRQMDKVERSLNLRGGSICLKPKWMHWTTFRKLQNNHVEFQVKAEEYLFKELRTWYPKSRINF